MKTVKEMRDYFHSLYVGGAIYVWGMNGEIIDADTINTAYKRSNTATYNRTYYDSKLKEGTGHIGADCSGSFYPMSGYDTTAQGYYNRCTQKGQIKGMDKTKAQMVFVEQSGRIVHVGWYDGNGYVYEMKNSKENCRHDKLSSRFTHYGVPEFVEDSKEESEKIMIELAELRKGSKGNEVKTLQRLLKQLGYSVGPSGVDGDFGTKTEGAVKKFQKAKGLTVDGIVGQNTWNKLLK